MPGKTYGRTSGPKVFPHLQRTSIHRKKRNKPRGLWEEMKKIRKYQL